MSYLICEKAVLQPFDYAAILTNIPYSKEFPSIDFELIVYLIHEHDKYSSDNKALFQLFGFALKVLMIHSSLSLFLRK